MFREMRRFKQQVSEEECRRVLREQPRGVLSMIGDNGYPYGIPLSYWYCEENGKIYFHGARTGHKIDAVKRCSKVSFCVYDEGYRKPGEWALNITSVVIFGRLRLVEDEEEAERICTELYRKFTDEEEKLEKELQALPRVQCLELTVEHMTGKLVNES
ncbi:MAG: pyridoxamine 5'-phosphate oxidase family protein [Blautia sp.]|nr:pyridoxamine 5'-phosphate oxidase family protein [Blautia sp.]